MPTYEYRCRDCGHELEVQQSFHDDPLTECPSCGGDLRKRFSPIGITFKGSGFYKTDSRSPSSSGAGTGNGEGSSSSNGSDGSSSTSSKESATASASA
ncbi:MAG: FmdB family transcriptional regulator [Acidimicrobiales bacterium]|nr:FmdB family transcriptional regulator [Acidimicrobiales bacterium]